MRKTSRIFLYLSGAMLIVASIFTVITLVLSWLTTLFNVGYNIVIIGMILGGGDRDIINGMLNFANFTDPIKFLLYIFGFIGAESLTDGTIVGYLIIETFVILFNIYTTTVGLVLPVIVAIVAAIIALKAASKKATKGNHIAAIVGGALAFYYSNIIWGAFMVLGGVFGNIADSKEAKPIEEAEAPKQIQMAPAFEEIG